MKNYLVSVRTLPLLLFLFGLIIVSYLILSGRLEKGIGSNPRAASTESMVVEGQIEKLPNCLDTFICYDLVEEETRLRYHLYSKRFPALLKRDWCLDKDKCDKENYTQINLEDYVGIKVKIKGLYLEQKISYLIITDIEVEGNHGN